MTERFAASDHTRLDVWQLSMDLLIESYAVARSLPVEERFGLAAQLRRAAVSTPANIAEGSGRSTPRDRLRFLTIARGSVNELRTLLIAIERLGYLSAERLSNASQLSDRTARLLAGLMRYVKRKAGAQG